MSETVTVSQAARLLGVSRSKIWALLREGTLQAQPNPLDKRQKLISLSALRELRREPRIIPAESTPTSTLHSVGAGSNASVRSDELESYLQEHWHPS